MSFGPRKLCKMSARDGSVPCHNDVRPICSAVVTIRWTQIRHAEGNLCIMSRIWLITWRHGLVMTIITCVFMAELLFIILFTHPLRPVSLYWDSCGRRNIMHILGSVCFAGCCVRGGLRPLGHSSSPLHSSAGHAVCLSSPSNNTIYILTCLWLPLVLLEEQKHLVC